jgi:hypothetical protein
VSDKNKTIVHLSLGFLLAILLHASLTAFLNRVPIEMFDGPRQWQPAQTFSFDSVEAAIGTQNLVNTSARDEIKKQICVPCIAQTTAPRPPVTQATQAKEYNLDLFIGSDPTSQAVMTWFNSYKQLSDFKARCNYQVYSPNNALYKARYASLISESQFPAILFTRADGGHIYVAGRGQIPNDAESLYGDIVEAWRLYKSVQSTPKPEQQSPSLPTIGSELQDCVDGTCPPYENRKPLFPWRDESSPLFPTVPTPDPVEALRFFLKRQTGVGLESLAIIALVVIVIILVIKRK